MRMNEDVNVTRCRESFDESHHKIFVQRVGRKIQKFIAVPISNIRSGQFRPQKLKRDHLHLTSDTSQGAEGPEAPPERVPDTGGHAGPRGAPVPIRGIRIFFGLLVGTKNLKSHTNHSTTNLPFIIYPSIHLSIYLSIYLLPRTCRGWR